MQCEIIFSFLHLFLEKIKNEKGEWKSLDKNVAKTKNCDTKGCLIVCYDISDSRQKLKPSFLPHSGQAILRGFRPVSFRDSSW